MNEMNELEMQLRSWAPRPPSARISRALFGCETAQEPSRRASRVSRPASSAFLLNWLAPAVAAVALLFAFFHLPTSPTLSNRPGAAPIIAVILSNQSLGSVLLEASNREPASPASTRGTFDMNGLGSNPKVFGVATSGVSTGASKRLPGWRSQPQMEDRGDNPATNGARLAPQAAIPVGAGAWLCAERCARSPRTGASLPAGFLERSELPSSGGTIGIPQFIGVRPSPGAATPGQASLLEISRPDDLRNLLRPGTGALGEFVAGMNLPQLIERVWTLAPERTTLSRARWLFSWQDTHETESCAPMLPPALC